jgi:ParB-like nuclease domain
MMTVGQLHPCIVTHVNDTRLQLVAGERRWRAAVCASLAQVWCMVKPRLGSPERLRMAIWENQMREHFTTPTGSPPWMPCRLWGKMRREDEGNTVVSKRRPQGRQPRLFQ